MEGGEADGVLLLLLFGTPGDNEAGFGRNDLVAFGLELLDGCFHAGREGGNAYAVRGGEEAFGIAQGGTAAEFEHLAFAVFEIAEEDVAVGECNADGDAVGGLDSVWDGWQEVGEEVAGGVDVELLFGPGDANVERSEGFVGVGGIEVCRGQEVDGIEFASFGFVDGRNEDGLAVGGYEVFDVGLEEVFFEVAEIDAFMGLLEVGEEALDCGEAVAGGILLEGELLGMVPLFGGEGVAGLGGELLEEVAYLGQVVKAESADGLDEAGVDAVAF